MKFKVVVLCSIFLMCANVRASSAFISQTRSKAQEVARKLEKLIKEDVVANADEIDALEKQFQDSIRSLNQAGQQKIANELSLQLTKLQSAKVQADVSSIAQQAQEIRETVTDEAVKGKVAKLESELQDLRQQLLLDRETINEKEANINELKRTHQEQIENLQKQFTQSGTTESKKIEDLKVQLDESKKQYQSCKEAEKKTVSELQTQIKRKDGEILALGEQLKKATSSGQSGAAQSTVEHECAQTKEENNSLKAQLADLRVELDQARSQSQEDVGATIKERLKMAEQRAEAAEKSAAEAQKEISMLQSNIVDQKAEIAQLRETIGKRRSEMVSKLKEFEVKFKEYKDNVKKINNEQISNIEAALKVIVQQDNQQDRQNSVDGLLGYLVK